MIYYYIFFFFSSRRRHTRCSRDWSSDCALPILPDALVWRQTSPGSTPPRFDTPPPGKPVARPRAASTPPPAKMFAAVPPPPRRMWKVLGAIGAVAVLAALALVWSARRGIRTPFQSVIGAPAPAHGELRVTSR